jgi:tRNA (adenine22-N1)-methyltransferase
LGYNKKLSPRLLAMVGYVQEGERVLDVGSDHAMLPLYLVENGVSPGAILTDRVSGPLYKAYGQVSRVVAEADGMETGDPSDRVRAVTFPCRLGAYEFRLGDGLAAACAGEADVAVIAGMGGETIAGILAREAETAAGFRRLILQPRTKTAELRTYLQGAGFALMADTAAEEKGRMCDILVAAVGL